MLTRHKASTQQTPPRTAEVQKQIEDDAKLAKRINMLPRSPIRKENNGILRSQIRKPSITSRRLAFDRGAGLKGTLRKDARLKKAQAQAGGISVVAAVGVSEVAAETPPHGLIVSDSESEEEATEANDPENWVGEAAPGSISKRLRSLFKQRVEAQDADKEEQIQDSVNLDSKETLDFMNENIAQSIPPHLRQKFAAATVASIRRLEWVSDRQMIGEVSDTMRELLRKPCTTLTGSTKAIRGQAHRTRRGRS